MRIVSETEFSARVSEMLTDDETIGILNRGNWVTGPGRSGAIAAVYVSHLLSIPFVPFGQFAAPQLGSPVLVDTARQSGRTMRKAVQRYRHRTPYVWIAFEEPPRVAFWYEARA